MTSKTETNIEAWLGLQELLGPMVDAVAGHRAKLEAAGFSPTAAEMMAIDFHRGLINQTFTGLKK
jgi:hypothetical protein